MNEEFITLKSICNHNTTLISYLSERFTYYDLDKWNQILLEGKIYVNGIPQNKNLNIIKGDEILTFVEKSQAKEPAVDKNFSVEWEDEHLIFVTKSGDIPIHPAGRYKENTLLSVLNKFLDKDVFPCHRLDRETSGLILFSKNSKISREIAYQFQSRRVKKEYRVFVYGNFPDKMVLEGSILPDENSLIRKKKKFISQISSKESYALTEFVKISFQNGISYLSAFPLTGRIHQIRASLFSMGYPVVGDKIYGKDETIFLKFIETGWQENFRLILGHNRQALHSYSIEIIHPLLNKSLKIISPLPLDLSF